MLYQEVRPLTLARYVCAAKRSHECTNWQSTGFVEKLWEEGESTGLAGNTLSGVEDVLRTRRAQVLGVGHQCDIKS